MAGLVMWTLTDMAVGASGESYDFEINPNEGGTPQRKRNVDQRKTVAPDGLSILYEGAESPQEITWSGVLRSSEQFLALQEWYEKHHQIELTDDLGRSYWIYIKSFQPERVRARNAQWKHRYTITATVLDWETEL